MSVLALLDLSAAFDTIDHNILIKRLKIIFGIDGTALEWIKSYLTARTQKVKIKTIISSPLELKFGVPQGSVLGPVLFSLYIQSLSEVIENFKFNYHMYADDSQLYKSVLPCNIDNMLKDLACCISSVHTWMHNNKLKMNNDKTEIMLVGTQHKLNNIITNNISINNENITLSYKVKDLGVVLDDRLSMNQAVSHIRKICFLELRKIAHLRPLLTEKATIQLILSFVLSRLDYCNSLFYSISNDNINKLQQIQNHAARLIKKVPKRQSITPILKQLHWLPVKARIEYKIALLVYNSLNDENYPLYLKDLLTVYSPTRVLRSSSNNLLKKNIPKLKCYGERAFTFAAPDVWNSIPDHVKNSPSIDSFKKNLKTYLFTLYYC